MMVPVNILCTGYKRALHYGECNLGEKLGQKAERYADVKQKCMQSMFDVITITAFYLSVPVSGTKKIVTDTSLNIAF